MSESPKDPVTLAAMRLEAAVERLARAISARPPHAVAAAGGDAGVAREQLAALARRLDETVARLRDALGEEEDEDDGGGEEAATAAGAARREEQ
jgi:hypothetical protein